MQHALPSVTLEPEDVLAEERMTVVISMVIWENAYKHVILLKIILPAEVQSLSYICDVKSCSIHCKNMIVILT